MWVVKVGGSLLDRQPALDPIMQVLRRAGTDENLTLVVGGGRAADLIRRFDALINLRRRTSHRMAMLAMQLNTVRLAMRYPWLQPALAPPRPGEAASVFLAGLSGFDDGGLPQGWHVTSDSIAAKISLDFSARLILLKDVDGVYDVWPSGNLIAELGPAELESLESSPVDEHLPKFLAEHKMDAWILNGLRPERLERLVSGQEVVCTHIVGSGVPQQ